MKELDPRIVEYAFAQTISINPNQQASNVLSRTTTYKHNVNIQYELRDSSKKILANKQVQHSVNASNVYAKDTIATYISLVNSNLNGWIAMDKKNLSGFGS